MVAFQSSRKAPAWKSWLRFLFNYFQGRALSLFGAANQKQGTNRVDGAPLAPDNPPDVVRMQTQLVDGQTITLDWSDEHYARAATGRTPLTDAERLALGADADRFPLFS